MAGQGTLTSLSVTLAASKRAKPERSRRRKHSESQLPTASLSSTSAKTKLKTKKIKESLEDNTAFILRQHEMRQRVLAAVSDNKVFLCYGYPVIAESLTKRGWVQKNKPTRKAASLDWLSTNESFGGPEALDAWIERTLQNAVPSFIWAFRSRIKWKALFPHQIVSVHPKAMFTTKDGLLQCLSKLHWFSETGNAFTFAPRAYRLRDVEERAVFVSDYRLTACIGILKWIVGTYDESGLEGIMEQEEGSVPSSIIQFAVQRVNRYIHERRHKDLDHLKYPYIKPQLWENVLKQFNELLFYKGKMKNIPKEEAEILYETSKKSLQRLAPFWNLNIDGTHNVWIFKPARRSNGVGLMVTNSLDEIMELDMRVKSKYEHVVIQKYVERPLLIYNTKFDIRQWFLVSDWNPLTIWTYRESYIRFSTQPFTTENFSRSIHLCNNSVQRRFQVSKFRDPNLPGDNMWDHYTFQAYLKTCGQEDAWETKIYPGMKQAILGIMLAYQEDTVVRKNCFEIYGADFILDEELNPWLLEINSGPTMAHSTTVTERMCRQFQEDIIKLIIDYQNDPYANVGMFELAYRHSRHLKSIITVPHVVVKGKRLKLKNRREASMSSSAETLGVVSTYSIDTEEETEGNAMQLNVSPPPPPTKGIAFHDLVSRFNLKDIRESGQMSLPLSQPPNALLSTTSLMSDGDEDDSAEVLTDYDYDDDVMEPQGNNTLSLAGIGAEKPAQNEPVPPSEVDKAASSKDPKHHSDGQSPSTTSVRRVKDVSSKSLQKVPSRLSKPVVKPSRAISLVSGGAHAAQSLPVMKKSAPATPTQTSSAKVKANPVKWNYDALDPRLARVGIYDPKQNRPTSSGKKARRTGGNLALKDILPQLSNHRSALQHKPSLPPLFREYLHFWDKLQ